MTTVERDSGEIRKLYILGFSFLMFGVALINAVLAFAEYSSTGSLSPLTTDASGQLNVLWHDGDTLSVDGAEVGVLEQTDEVGFASLLESHDRGALESQVSLEVLGDFTNQSLEGELPQQKFGRLLVSTDFSEGNCSGPVSVGFLDTSGGGCALAGGFGCQLFPGSLSSSGFTGGLLGTSHFVEMRFLICFTR